MEAIEIRTMGNFVFYIVRIQVIFTTANNAVCGHSELEAILVVTLCKDVHFLIYWLLICNYIQYITSLYHCLF